MVLVEVKRKSDTKVCRVSLDGVALKFDDDVATRNLPAGEHSMSWHVVGNKGQKYEVWVTQPKGIECHPKETLTGGTSFGVCPINL